MISSYLKFDEPTSLDELQKLTGLSKRAIRQSIERERQIKKPFVIISSSRFKGFYKTTDREKILAYLVEQNHRAKKIFFNTKGANLYLKEEGQLELKCTEPMNVSEN